MNWDPYIIFSFPGQPVPYVRMTQGSKWTQTAQNYLGYRNALADAMRAQYRDLVLPPAPPTSIPKERAQFNKEQKKYLYGLKVLAFLEKDTGDLDNYVKTAADAIQAAGLIWNDKLIKDLIDCRCRIDKQAPRLEIYLFRRKAEEQ